MHACLRLIDLLPFLKIAGILFGSMSWYHESKTCRHESKSLHAWKTKSNMYCAHETTDIMHACMSVQTGLSSKKQQLQNQLFSSSHRRTACSTANRDVRRKRLWDLMQCMHASCELSIRHDAHLWLLQAQYILKSGHHVLLEHDQPPLHGGLPE